MTIIKHLTVQVVVVVGNSLSGQDISIELVEVAKEVYLSSKSLNISEGLSKILAKHDTLHLRPQVQFLISKFLLTIILKYIEANNFYYNYNQPN